MVSYMRLRPGIVLHFTLHCFISISLFVDYVEGSNYFVSVCITAWNNIVCYLASPLLCGGGLYVEVLGLSAAGELGGVGILWRWVFRRVSKIALGYTVWPSFKWLFLAASE